MSASAVASSSSTSISKHSLRTPKTSSLNASFVPQNQQKSSFHGLSLLEGRRVSSIVDVRRSEGRRGLEVTARTAASKTIEVEVDKPLGLTLGQKSGGGVVITAVDSGGNAAKAGLKAGDQVLYTSSFFGDELWPADKLGFTKTAIQAKPDSIFFVVSRGAEVDVKRLPKRPAPPRFGRKLTESQKARATHICLDCGFIYTLQKPFDEQDSMSKIRGKSSMQLSHLMQDQQKNATNGEHLREVKLAIESCLISYMTREDTVKKLNDVYKIDPLITMEAWRRLEKENVEFFIMYNTKLRLIQQINSFNHLLERQYQLMCNYPDLAAPSTHNRNKHSNDSTMVSPYAQGPAVPTDDQSHLDPLDNGSHSCHASIPMDYKAKNPCSLTPSKETPATATGASILRSEASTSTATCTDRPETIAEDLEDTNWPLEDLPTNFDLSDLGDFLDFC